MNVVAIVAICFIPLAAFFVCVALLAKKFSVLRGLVSCALGLLAVIPIAVIQFFVGKSSFFAGQTLPVMLISALIVNGLIEESIKMAVLFLLPAKKMDLSEFFLCSLIASLTIASFENLVYLVGGLEHFELRLFTAVLIHVTCGGLSGLFVYTARMKKPLLFPFVLAILFHGVYDYFAMFPLTTPFFYFSIVAILFSVVECKLRYGIAIKALSGEDSADSVLTDKNKS